MTVSILTQAKVMYNLATFFVIFCSRLTACVFVFVGQLMGVDTGNATVEPWRLRPSGLGNCCRSIREEQRLLVFLGHILRRHSLPRNPLQRQCKVSMLNQCK